MSLVDLESSFQVDFPLNVIFTAASKKLAHLPKFTLIRADKILHKITMKVRGNLFSWGENAPSPLRNWTPVKLKLMFYPRPKREPLTEDYSTWAKSGKTLK